MTWTLHWLVVIFFYAKSLWIPSTTKRYNSPRCAGLNVNRLSHMLNGWRDHKLPSWELFSTFDVSEKLTKISLNSFSHGFFCCMFGRGKKWMWNSQIPLPSTHDVERNKQAKAITFVPSPTNSNLSLIISLTMQTHLVCCCCAFYCKSRECIPYKNIKQYDE